MSWPGGRGTPTGGSRKVRTSQSRVIANSNPRRLAGKCHRKQTATLVVVRVKRCGKSAPAFRVTGVAWQTPPEARPRRPHLVRPRRRSRAARPSLRVGRLRHPATVCPDGWSPPRRRCSSAAAGNRIRLTGQLVRPLGASVPCFAHRLGELAQRVVELLAATLG